MEYTGKDQGPSVISLELEKLSRDQLQYLIVICDKCGRYEDMLQVVESLVVKYSNLKPSEKSYFEKPIKQIIGLKQKKLSKLSNIEKLVSKSEDEDLIKMINEETETLNEEVSQICYSKIKLISNHLLKNISNKETEVFLNRIIADLYKYLSQVERDMEKYYLYSDKYYKESLNIANSLGKLNLEKLNTIFAYAKFLINFKKELTDANYLLHEIVRLPELEDFYDGTVTYDDEVNNILTEIKYLYDKIQVNQE